MKLLEEEDAATIQRVIEALSDAGLTALEPLRCAAEYDSPRTRLRARAVLQRLVQRHAEEPLAELLRGGKPDLEQALILLAVIESPRARPEDLSAELDALTDTARKALKQAASPLECVQAFVHTLLTGGLFSADDAAVRNLSPWLLDSFLATRRASAEMLTALLILLARRSGMKAHAVFRSRKMLLRIRKGHSEFVVDAAGGGNVLTAADCRAMLSGFSPEYREEFFTPVSDRDLLCRILEGIQATDEVQADPLRIARMHRMVQAVHAES